MNFDPFTDRRPQRTQQERQPQVELSPEFVQAETQREQLYRGAGIDFERDADGRVFPKESETNRKLGVQPLAPREDGRIDIEQRRGVDEFISQVPQTEAVLQQSRERRRVAQDIERGRRAELQNFDTMWGISSVNEERWNAETRSLERIPVVQVGADVDDETRQALIQTRELMQQEHQRSRFVIGEIDAEVGRAQMAREEWIARVQQGAMYAPSEQESEPEQDPSLPPPVGSDEWYGRIEEHGGVKRTPDTRAYDGEVVERAEDALPAPEGYERTVEGIDEGIRITDRKIKTDDQPGEKKPESIKKAEAPMRTPSDFLREDVEVPKTTSELREQLAAFNELERELVGFADVISERTNISEGERQSIQEAIIRRAGQVEAFANRLREAQVNLAVELEDESEQIANDYNKARMRGMMMLKRENAQRALRLLDTDSSEEEIVNAAKGVGLDFSADEGRLSDAQIRQIRSRANRNIKDAEKNLSRFDERFLNENIEALTETAISDERERQRLEGEGLPFVKTSMGVELHPMSFKPDWRRERNERYLWHRGHAIPSWEEAAQQALETGALTQDEYDFMKPHWAAQAAREQEIDDRGILRVGKDSFMSAVHGTIGSAHSTASAIMTRFGRETAAGNFAERHKNRLSRAAKYSDSMLHIDDVQGPQDLLRAAMSAGAMSSISISTIMASTWAGGKTGAVFLGKPGAIIGAIIGGFSSGHALYFGDAYATLLEQGVDEKDAFRIANMGAAPASLVSLYWPMAWQGIMMRAGGQSLYRRTAQEALKDYTKRIGVYTAGGSVLEGTAEGFAETFMIAAERSAGLVIPEEEAWARRRNATFAGAVFGSVMGVAPGVKTSGRMDVNMANALLEKQLELADQRRPVLEEAFVQKLEAKAKESGGLNVNEQKMLDYLKALPEMTTEESQVAVELEPLDTESARIMGWSKQEQALEISRLMMKGLSVGEGRGNLTEAEANRLMVLFANNPGILSEYYVRASQINREAQNRAEALIGDLEGEARTKQIEKMMPEMRAEVIADQNFIAELDRNTESEIQKRKKAFEDYEASLKQAEQTDIIRDPSLDAKQPDADSDEYAGDDLNPVVWVVRGKDADGNMKSIRVESVNFDRAAEIAKQQGLSEVTPVAMQEVEGQTKAAPTQQQQPAEAEQDVAETAPDASRAYGKTLSQFLEGKKPANDKAEANLTKAHRTATLNAIERGDAVPAETGHADVDEAVKLSKSSKLSPLATRLVADVLGMANTERDGKSSIKIEIANNDHAVWKRAGKRAGTPRPGVITADGSTIYINPQIANSERKAVSVIIHEAAHSVGIGMQDFISNEWQSLSNGQRRQAAEEYGEGLSEMTDAELADSPVASQEWFAFQFHRVLKGDETLAGVEKSYGKRVADRIRQMVERFRKMVTNYIGDKSLSTTALDARISEIVGDYVSSGRMESTITQTQTQNEAQLQAEQAEGRQEVEAEGREAVEGGAKVRIGPDGEIAYDRDVLVASIVVNKDVPQFKSDADPVTGEEEGNRLGDFNVIQSGRIYVWEKLSGELEVISGRHRFASAVRSGAETIPAYVFREADGFTVQDAIMLDAESNIRDGHGKVKDYAHYFKQAGISRKEAEDRQLLSNDKGRQGWALGQEAIQSLYDLYANGKIGAEKAAAIASAAPNNTGAQMLGMRKQRDLTAQQLNSYTKEIARMKGIDTGEGATQTTIDDLLGGEDFARIEAEAEAFAIEKSNMIAEVRAQIAAGNNAAKNPEAAKKLGVDVKNPEATKRQIEELRQRLEVLENPDAAVRNEIRKRAGLPVQEVTAEQEADVSPPVDPNQQGLFDDLDTEKPKAKKPAPVKPEVELTEAEKELGDQQSAAAPETERGGQKATPPVSKGSGKGKLPKDLAQRILSLGDNEATYPLGPRNAAIRQDILEAIAGKRPSKSAAGAGKVRDAMMEFFGIEATSGFDSQALLIEALEQSAGKEFADIRNFRQNLIGSGAADHPSGTYKILASDAQGAYHVIRIKDGVRERVSYDVESLSDAIVEADRIANRGQNPVNEATRPDSEPKGPSVSPPVSPPRPPKAPTPKEPAPRLSKAEQGLSDALDGLFAPAERPTDAQDMALNDGLPEGSLVENNQGLPPSEYLARMGISVIESKTKTGKTVWRVKGPTFNIKEILKNEHNASFYRKEKAWSIFGDEDPTAGIAQSIRSAAARGEDVTGESGNAGRRIAENESRRLREREDGRADERRDSSDLLGFVSNKTRSLISRGLKVGIPEAEVNKQIADIGLAVTAYEAGKPLFIDSSSPGTGKTFVLGGIMRELSLRGENNIVYVTMNQSLISQIQKDLADYGIRSDSSQAPGADSMSRGMEVKQSALPKGKATALVAVAEQLIEDGINTPDAFVRTLDKIAEVKGKPRALRQYANALWKVFEMVDESAAPVSDWGSVFSLIDGTRQTASERVGVRFVTYSDLSNKGGVNVDGAILIFDEGHNVKNSDASARGKKAQSMMGQAKMTILASATPFENPVQASYLATTGLFEPAGGFNAWAKAYGAASRVKEYTNYRTGERVVEENVWWPGGKAKDGIAARDWFFKQGILAHRAMRLPNSMVDSVFIKSAVSDEYVDLYNKVDEAYQSALSYYLDANGKPMNPIAYANISAHRSNTLKRILEASKMDEGIKRAKDWLSKTDENGNPYNVVLFVETKADRHLGRFRMSRAKQGDRLYTYPEIQKEMSFWEAAAAAADAQREARPPRPFAEFVVEIARSMHEQNVDQLMPSVEETIVSELGGESAVSVYTGNVTDSVAMKNKADFLEGRKRVLVATMAKGGTGLSLHDQVGNRPTAQVNVNLPWVATGVDQVSGRVARYGLQSRATIEWLFANNIEFENSLASRVGGRMRDMGAIVKGIDSTAAKKLTEGWSFDGEVDASQQTEAAVFDAGDTGDGYYEQAFRDEKARTAPKDTSRGFFETPFPLAALAARAGQFESGASILDTSSGRGNLVRYLPEGVSATAIEVRSDNFKQLQANLGRWLGEGRFEAINADFLEWAKATDQRFGGAIINPPFERMTGVGPQDVAHVMAAWDLLSPNARLVAILGEGAFFRQAKSEAAFREWLEDIGATVIKLPEGTFKKSGTMVNARMIIADKNSDFSGRNDIDLSDVSETALADIEAQVPNRISKPLYAPAERDTAHANAVERGDMETAQRLVDEAARLAGYDIGPVYHGTSSDFDVFKMTPKSRAHHHPSRVMGAFFTNRKNVAERYAQGAGGKRVVQAFLKIENPKTLQLDEFYQAYDGYKDNDWKKKERKARADAESFQKQGHDGIIADGGYEIIAFDPSQIKSAEPATYDSEGNLIPLSQRFNPESDSILYAPAERMESETGIPARRWRLLQRKKERDTLSQFELAEMEMIERELGQEFMSFWEADNMPLNASDSEKIAALRLRAEHESRLRGDDIATQRDLFESGLFDTDGQGMLFAPKGAGVSPAFYSQLESVIDTRIPGRTASPDQVKGIINNPKNQIKAEEVKWSGVEQAIDRIARENSGKVPKDALLAYLRDEGAVRFEEVSIGKNNHPRDKKVARMMPFRDDFGSNYTVEFTDGTFIEDVQADNEAEALREAIRMYDADASVLSSIAVDGDNMDVPRYAEYVLPGGENYREVVLAMPFRENSDLQQLEREYAQLYNERNTWMDRYIEVMSSNGLETTPQQAIDAWQLQHGKRAMDLQNSINRLMKRGDYTSSHFPDVLNYVAHMRLNERTDAEGNDGLFIEEIQSDRHQEGRKSGYRDDAPTKRELWIRKSEQLQAQRNSGEITEQEFDNQMRAAAESFNDTSEVSDRVDRIPDAPFRTTWPLAMFKRALRDAVASGKDWIGWTVGETQADRYDLSKQVESMEWYSYERRGSTKMVVIQPLSGNLIELPITNEGVVIEGVGTQFDGKRIDEVIGKDLAEKIMTEKRGSLSGDGLKVGGEGMKGFYDTMLPKEIGKYVKRWGAKVERASITNPEGRALVQYKQVAREMFGRPPTELTDAELRQVLDETAKREASANSTPIWRVDITPAMREGVEQGQTLFAPKEKIEINAELADLMSERTTTAEDPRSMMRRAFDWAQRKRLTARRESVEAIADNLAPLKFNMEDTYGPGSGSSFDAAFDPWKSGHHTRDTRRMWEGWLINGAYRYEGGDVAPIKGSKGFVPIFFQVYKQAGSKKEALYLTQLSENYLAALRANELLKDGRERNFGFDRKGYIEALARGEEVSVDDFWSQERAQQEIDSIIAEAKKYPSIVNFQKEYAQWNKQILDYMEASGVFSKDQRSQWESEFYVPFNRVMDAADEAKRILGPKASQDPRKVAKLINRLKGGTGKVAIIENIINNLGQFLQEASVNQAKEKMVRMLGHNGDIMERVPYKAIPLNTSRDELIRVLAAQHYEDLKVEGGIPDGMTRAQFIKKALADADKGSYESLGINTQEQLETRLQIWRMKRPQGENIMTVMVNGKPQFWKIHDAGTMRAVMALGPDAWQNWASTWLKPFNVAKQFLTEAITLSPSFVVANASRETLWSWVASKELALPGISLATGTLEMWKKGGLEGDLAGLGLGQGANWGGFRNDPMLPKNARKAVMRMTEAEMKSFRKSVLNSPKKLAKLYMHVVETAEYANRYGLAKEVLASGGSRSEAAFQAKFLTNFSSHGGSDFVRALVYITPFLNSRIQGLYRTAHAAGGSSPEMRARAKALFAMKAAILVSATIGLLSINWDNEDYEKLQQWDKDAYWHVFLGGQHFRIPKPFEIGALFGMIPEVMVRGFVGKDKPKDVRDSLWRMITQTFAIDLRPQGILQWDELQKNKASFTGRPIEAFGDQFKAPQDRYGIGTPETFKEIANRMPANLPESLRFLQSPKQLEHVWRGLTGTLGTYAIDISDILVNRAMDGPEPPAKHWRDAPILRDVVGRFWRSPEPRSSKYVGEFYELYRAAEDTVRQIQRARERGEEARIDRLLERSGGSVEALPELKRINTQMSAISARQREVRFDPFMSREEKRDEQRELTKQRNELARRGVDIGLPPPR